MAARNTIQRRGQIRRVAGPSGLRRRRAKGDEPGEEVEFEEREGALLLRRAGVDGPLDRLVGLVKESVGVDAYLAQARGPTFPRLARRAEGREGEARAPAARPMITAVDSSVLLDVLTDAPTRAAASLEALRRALRSGPVVACPSCGPRCARSSRTWAG